MCFYFLLKLLLLLLLFARAPQPLSASGPPLLLATLCLAYASLVSVSSTVAPMQCPAYARACPLHTWRPRNIPRPPRAHQAPSPRTLYALRRAYARLMSYPGRLVRTLVTPCPRLLSLMLCAILACAHPMAYPRMLTPTLSRVRLRTRTPMLMSYLRLIDEVRSPVFRITVQYNVVYAKENSVP